MVLEKALEASNNVDGWLSSMEQALLYTLASKVPADKAIVELGTWMGKSTIMLAAGSLSGSKAPVYSVDLFTLPVNDLYDYSRHLNSGTKGYLPLFWKNISDAGLASTVTPVKRSTVEAAKAWTGPPVRLLFIDANHSYPAVRSDFLAWVRHCSPGARVVFHDYVRREFPGVRRFVDRLVMTGILTEVEIIDSILLGALAITDLSSVNRHLALCPIWLSRSLAVIRKLRRAAIRVLNRGSSVFSRAVLR